MMRLLARHPRPRVPQPRVHVLACRAGESVGGRGRALRVCIRVQRLARDGVGASVGAEGAVGGGGAGGEGLRVRFRDLLVACEDARFVLWVRGGLVWD